MSNISGGTSFTPILIGDKVSFPNGSSDSSPQFTMVNGEPVTVALELQSTTGALLISRMTTSQRNEMNVDNGMLIYNITESAFDMYANGSWKVITGGAILPTVPNDVAIFDDTSGTIKDSGVPIAPRLPLSLSMMAPDSNLEISNLGYVQFAGTAGYAFLGEQAAVQLFSQPSPQNICVVVTDGSIPPSPSSDSCAFEINTRSGAFLLSRMDQADVDILPNPQDGMMLYNAEKGKFQGRESGAWSDIITSKSGVVEKITDITGDYEALESDNVILSINQSPYQNIISLPVNPVTGQFYKIYDATGNAANIPIAINANGKGFNGVDAQPSALLPNLSTFDQPYRLAVTPVSDYLYCINIIGNNVSIYNERTLVATIGGLNQPEALRVSPNGNFVLIANGGATTGTNGLTVIQNASGSPSFLRNINTGNTPISLDYSTNGSFAYVGNSASNSITIIQNASTNPTFSSTFNSDPTISTPFAMKVNPNANYLYVANLSSSNLVSVLSISGSSLAPFSTFSDGGDIGAVFVNTTNSGNYVWVASSFGNIIIFNAVSSATVKRFNLGIGNETQIVFTPSGNYAYVISVNSNSVYIYKDVETNNPVLLKTILLENTAAGIGISFNPGGYYCYVASQSTNRIYVIKGASGPDPSLSKIMPTGSSPSDVIVTNKTGIAYVSNRSSSNLSFYQYAAGYRYIIDNYGAAHLLYNGVEWNAVRLFP